MNRAERVGKTDRTARLLKVEHLLYQNPKGLKVEEIARLCGVNKRTTYRDLGALESELGLPIWGEGIRRGIVEGYLLPPIHFTLAEALNIFLAARLMLSYAHRYDPNIASTFTKLNSIVTPPLRDQIQKTIGWMQSLPKNDKFLHTLTTLAEAWVSQHQVKISYRALTKEKAAERIIDPYFIEPAAPGHSCYVIAYCHRTDSLRTFKIERIVDIQVMSDSYVLSSGFDANAYLGSSWGISVEGGLKTIKLKFTPEISRIMEETMWHPSQVLECQSDGSVIMTLRITDTAELRSWILGWGEKIQVLEPDEIRQNIIETAKAMLDVYQ
ncbi:helix-turn-helix transcriptional regulator [Chloroflexota bacterium]